DAVPGTGLTPASLYIETEPSFFVSSCFRIRSRCKKISDQIEHSCVCCRIRPWSPADRGLVDVDYLVHLFKPFDPPVLSGDRPCMVQIPGKPFVQDLIYKRTLSGTGNSRHTGHNAQRELHIDVLQVILRGSDHLQESSRL